jgi:hypothetical protein
VSPPLLAAIALITYASRALALVVLPRPGTRLEAVLARMPAPIFASLAMSTLIGDDRALAATPILWAAAGALLAAPLRSLALCLIGGAAGYALAALVS